MRRRSLELLVGTGLLLGPLVHALTLEPVVVEVVELVPVAEPSATVDAAPVIPALEESAAPEQGPPAPDHRLPFAFVTSAGVVLDVDADPSWATGRLRDHRGPGEFRASKRVDAGKIPDEIWWQRGRTFELYGASGRVCTARLGELAVLAQHDGPSIYDLFSDEDQNLVAYEDVDLESQPPPRKEIRERVWTSPDTQARWLVAEVLSDESCDGALWARDSELPEPVVLRPSDEPSAVTRERMDALRSSSAYAQLREEYTAWHRDELADEDRKYYGDWSRLEAESTLSARAWLDASGTAHWVEVVFGTNDVSCGDGPTPYLTAMERLVDGAMQPTDRGVEPVAIFDADLDGRFELLYEWGRPGSRSVVTDSSALDVSISVFEAFICPC